MIHLPDDDDAAPRETRQNRTKIQVNEISLNPFVIARILGAVAVLLILASVAGQLSKFVFGLDRLGGLVPLFHVDTEQNIPTFFSALLMLFSVLLLAVIARLRRKTVPYDNRWSILSFVFLFMAFDEAFRFHERLNSPVSALLGDDPLGVFHSAWVIPGTALVIVLGLFFSRFLLHLPATTRRRFLMAAILYIGGAIGVELIGARFAKFNGVENLIYSMIATVEESLEMAGLIVFIWALLEHYAVNYNEVRFRFGPSEARQLQ